MSNLLRLIAVLASLLTASQNVSANPVVVFDSAQGKVIFASDAGKPWYPASLTKIMTAYIAAEEIKQGNLNYSDQVHISEKAWRTGGSRMFTVRGPMMVADVYEPATMKVDIWQKDMKIIAEFAAGLDCPTPLLSACASTYTAAMAQGRGAQDTAAVCAVLADMARLQRTPRPD